MNLILFGFKGCGKTYFGKLAAQELKRPFVDTDELIVNLYGQKNLTVREVYKRVGEAEFRLLEREAVRSLELLEASVIALGGGSILDFQNRELLEKIGSLAYLETGLKTLQRRGTNPIAGPIESLYRERLPLYRAIPATRIDTDLLKEKEIVKALCSIIMEKTHAL